ncbi:MAG: ferritin [Candidatus Thermoplasmatota archaeon]|nr:ferritin [Candidatus Thermoplasmatota archaeon]
MIGERMNEALNQQINEELYSAYLYLAMSADFQEKGFPGFANWMRVQFQEEQAHAMMLYDYIVERGGSVKLMAIKEPPKNWPSLLKAFQEALAHEEYITGKINELVDIAIEVKDHAANNFLQWYVKEQVEEEANANANVDQLKIVGEEGRGLLMLDREMGARVFTPPAESVKE